MVYSLVAASIGCTLDFEHLADTSVVAIVVQYMATALAVLALRRTKGPSPRFRLPLGPVIPVAATVGSLLFLAGAGWKDLVMGFVLLVLGVALGTAVRRVRK
jgi:amino acid transporter